MCDREHAARRRINHDSSRSRLIYPSIYFIYRGGGGEGGIRPTLIERGSIDWTIRIRKVSTWSLEEEEEGEEEGEEEVADDFGSFLFFGTSSFVTEERNGVG